MASWEDKEIIAKEKSAQYESLKVARTCSKNLEGPYSAKLLQIVYRESKE